MPIPKFTDRSDAGRRLGQALEKYRDANPIVLAIPKGGIPVGVEAARYLNADFSILIARKLPFPWNPEGGFGAVAEDGSTCVFPELSRALSKSEIDGIVGDQRREIERRIQILRRGQPLPSLDKRTVIVVDDGIAVGSTMRAAVTACRNRGAARVVVASPVSSQRALTQFEAFADDAVILETPPDFRAVAEIFHEWHDITDDEARALLAE